MTTQHLTHIARWHEYILHLMDVTILTGDVALHDTIIEDVRSTFCKGSTRKDSKVAFLAKRLDIIVQHILTCQVYHHRTRIVADKIYALAGIFLPIDITLRHFFFRHELDRVNHAHIGCVLQSRTLHRGICSIAGIGQHVKKQRIVKHRRIEKQLLLGDGEFSITLHTPFVVFEESLKSVIVGREHRLRSCTIEGLGIAKIVNEMQVIRESARQSLLVGVLQFRINASAKP